MAELHLNGVIEEIVGKYCHVCFFTDAEGYDRDNSDHYVYVPKTLCRKIDYRTVAIHDWYVRKKQLGQYTKKEQPGRMQSVQTKQVLKQPQNNKKAEVENIIQKVGSRRLAEWIKNYSDD